MGTNEEVVEVAAGPPENPEYHKGTLWFDNVFPFRLGRFDPRGFWIRKYAKRFVEDESWQRLVPSRFPEGSEFRFMSAEPNLKEGGLYLNFKYKGGTIEEAVETIQSHVAASGIRSVFNLSRINAFQVKGRPWVEDMVSRVPSSRLHVEFMGPDLTVEQLFREFRIFGKIVDITPQPAGSKDIPRFASVEFVNKRSATSARNCIHGEKIEATRVFIGYEKSQSHSFWWNWIMANLRISVPILLAVAASLSYIVFDPWRVFSITNQITGRFSLEKYTESAGELLSLARSSVLRVIFNGQASSDKTPRSFWDERLSEAKRLELYVKQAPETLVLVTGPKGSGKSDLINKALEHHPNKLVIHFRDLVGQLDHIILYRLANQVNFFPSFGFVSQISTFIDALITATTGAKANLSTTNEGEIRKILEAMTYAVTNITLEQQRRLKHEEQSKPGSAASTEMHYPVIVLDDYMLKESSRGSHMLYNLFAEWAALVSSQYHVAHVVFVTDNPAASRELSKYVPDRPVEMFVLDDAKHEAAAEYVSRRLPQIQRTDLDLYLKHLGGRLHDLDLVVQKIKAGQSPHEAFEDIVNRSISELRKIGLGEDTDKSHLPWNPIQFWKVVEILSKFEEVPFDNLCIHPVFKGDSNALIQMERAGILILNYESMRPVSIRVGKPIYRKAFQTMTNDDKLVATMGVMTAKQLVSDEQKKIDQYESELNVLTDVLIQYQKSSSWWRHLLSRSTPFELKKRIDFLVGRLKESSDKVTKWVGDEIRFKKVLKLKED